MVKRLAFTMIELIFAIVVISIAVLSLPTMISSINKNIESSIVQEAIYASETVLNEAMNYYWGPASQNDLNISGGLSRVINTGDCTQTLPNRRVGHVNRRCLDDNTVASSSELSDAAAVNTLEYLANEWNNHEIILNLSETTDPEVYKAQYTASVDVKRCTTAGGCIHFWRKPETISEKIDLKELTLTVENDAGENIILLRTYSANIGDVFIVKRVLP